MTAEVLAPRGRVVIVGAGLAGLMTALELTPQPVILLSKAALGAEGSRSGRKAGWLRLSARVTAPLCMPPTR